MPAFMPKPTKASTKATLAQGAGSGAARRAQGVEVEAAAMGGEHGEGQQDRQRPGVGHEQVEEGGAAVGGLLVLVGHQEVAGEGHELPRHHEHEGVVRQHHQLHARHEEAGEEPQHPQRVAAMAELTAVAGAVEGHREEHQADEQLQQAREGIEAQPPGEPGQPEGQGGGLYAAARERQQAGAGGEQPGGSQQRKGEVLLEVRLPVGTQGNHPGQQGKTHRHQGQR